MIEDSGFGVQSITLRDNSIRSIETTSTQSILPSLHPVFSSDGRDNVLSEETSFADVLTKYGSDFSDSNLYGQQNLLVEKTLEGGGVAYLCRLLPEDATTANLIIKVGVRSAESVPLYKRDQYNEFMLDEEGEKIPLTVTQMVETEVNGEMVMVEQQVPAFTTGIQFKMIVEPATTAMMEHAGSLLQLRNLAKNVTTDDDGYTIVPLGIQTYYANGKCGNDYGVRIVNDFARDVKVNDGRRYQLYFVKKTSSGAMTLSIADGLSFSFNPYATISKSIPAVEGLHAVYQNNDERNQQKQIQFETYIDNYDILKDLVTEILGQDVVTTEGIDEDYELRIPSSFNEIDFINGFDKEGIPFDNILIDEESAKLSNPHYMGRGSDGSFDTLEGEDLDELKNELLKKFFNGDIAKSQVLNVLKCDAGIMFDANYDIDVKHSMTNLLKWRRDICVIFDCGFTENLAEAIAVAKSIQTVVKGLGEGGENYAIVPHCGLTADRSVNIRTTATYEMAYGLRRLYRLSPFAVYSGKPGDYGCVRKMVFDWVIEETKPKGYEEKLAKQNRLYWATDLGKAMSSVATGNVTGRNVYFYSNASQYGEEISKLAEFRNGIIVNDIRRILKLILVKYTFDTEGAESSIDKASTELNKVIASRYPSNISIKLNLFQQPRDKLLNMATCKVEVLFPDIFETWSCEIIADRQI